MGKKYDDAYFKSTFATDKGSVETFVWFFKSPNGEISEYLSDEFVASIGTIGPGKWSRAEKDSSKWFLRSHGNGTAFEVLIPKHSSLSLDRIVDTSKFDVEKA